uniref:SRCR domain-containing protein n=1 Tax=Myotis lucifugus TaxID=59463 RepID=G1PW71_MYOLU
SPSTSPPLAPGGLAPLRLACPSAGGPGNLKLANRYSECDGLVLVQHEGVWGHVCNQEWTLAEASVVCRQLGCGQAVGAPKYVPLPQERKQPVLHNVSCRGDESSLWECSLGAWTQTQCPHEWMVVVLCTNGTFREIRLVKGRSPCSGLPEIRNLNGIDRLCGLHKTEATVFCQELGCGPALQASRQDAGTGGKYMTCQGTEPTIRNCRLNNNLRSGCDFQQDAEVVCSGSRRVRLAAGPGRCAGRVEVLHGGAWGTVCDDGWDLRDAHVVCGQLGCGHALGALGAAHFGSGSGRIWMDELGCEGNESALWQCPSGGWGQHDCGHKEDAGVFCSEEGSVRVRGGEDSCSGRVELWHEGSWGTVCDDAWDLADAEVVCRQLGCGRAISALAGAAFGPGSGPVWLDEVGCRGSEASLWGCPAEPWGRADCGHKEDAGVRCSRHTEARLAGGEHPCAGRLEVRRGLTWGTVCDEDLDQATAHVVCRELQCGMAASTPPGAHFGQGSGSVWTEAFRCAGNESLLFHCPRAPGHQCGHGQDAGLRCSGESRFRLVNGSSSCEGRVELQVQGAWAPLCAAHWDLADATVLCHQLNCGSALAAPRGGHFGHGSAPLWPDRFHCVGTEPYLWNCPVSTLGAPACAPGNSASVVCSGLRHALRLRDGGSGPCAGRLEVLFNGTWGGVCRPLSPASLGVLCGQLGCGPQGQLQAAVGTGKAPGTLWVASIQCRHRHDLSLWQCPSAPWDQRSCSSQEEAWVVCAEKAGGTPPGPGETLNCSATRSCPEEGSVRVNGGEDSCSGRVELWHEGSWGTVCDDAWDLADAEVVCRQLGCGRAISALAGAAFGPGSGPVWLDEVGCRGSEASLWGCPAEPWGRADCGHKEDAGVRCS